MSAASIAKEIIRRILCWPLYLGMLLALIIRGLWGRKMFLQDGILVVELHPDSWPNRTWYKNWGGTCFGYGIMLAPDMPNSVLAHEMVHAEQAEASACAGLIVGIVSSIVVGILGEPIVALLLFLGFHVSLMLLNYGAASLVAFLRGENGAYWGNHNEEAARSVSGQGV